MLVTVELNIDDINTKWEYTTEEVQAGDIINDRTVNERDFECTIWFSGAQVYTFKIWEEVGDNKVDVSSYATITVE